MVIQFHLIINYSIFLFFLLLSFHLQYLATYFTPNLMFICFFCLIEIEICKIYFNLKKNLAILQMIINLLKKNHNFFLNFILNIFFKIFYSVLHIENYFLLLNSNLYASYLLNFLVIFLLYFIINSFLSFHLINKYLIYQN